MKKLMVTAFKESRAGVTSLLVVIAIGLLLSGIVAGIATLSVREIRQASNNEQSRKALDVAESGLKLAAQKLVADQNYSVSKCPLDPTDTSLEASDYINLLGTASSTGQSITCVIAGNTFETYQGHLDQDRGQMFMVGPNITGGSIPESMMLKWHDTKVNGVLTGGYGFDPDSFYPSMYNNHAAAIEMTFLYWSSANVQPIAFGGANLSTSTIFIMPGQDDRGFTRSRAAGNISSGCITGTGSGSSLALGDYACGLVPYNPSGGGTPLKGISLAESITGLGQPAPTNVAVIIKPRYLGTNFELQFFDANGAPISFKSDKAQVDVTAKSGDLYRRVKALVPTSSSVIDNIFDSVIYAGKGAGGNSVIDICKKMSVKPDNSINTMDCPNQAWKGP